MKRPLTEHIKPGRPPLVLPGYEQAGFPTGQKWAFVPMGKDAPRPKYFAVNADEEDWIPPFADKPVFILAPAVIIVTGLMSFAIIPFAPNIFVANLVIGLLFFLATSSLGVYSIVLAGWSPNNKYSLLGGLRAAAQMISYEVLMVYNSQPSNQLIN